MRALLALFLLFPGLSLKASSSTTPPLVTVRVLNETDAAYPGSKLRAVVIAQIAPGYHLNAHEPTFDYLIPTRLEIKEDDSVTVEKVIYPAGQLKRFQFSSSALSVYEGTVLVGARLRLAPGANLGPHLVEGHLSYQACNDRACLPPARVPVVFPIQVVPRTRPLQPLHKEIFSQVKFE